MPQPRIVGMPMWASRIDVTRRAMDPNSAYGKRMERLSNRIFGEVVRPTDKKSMRVVEIMSAEPWEQREDKSVKYFPNLPMFHYLTKMLRLHGVFHEEHHIWRTIQDQQKILRGKVVNPPIGQGKRAMIRKAKGGA